MANIKKQTFKSAEIVLKLLSAVSPSPLPPTAAPHFVDEAKALYCEYPGVPDSMDRQTPLIGRFEVTDKLIDQIVYRLYGLIGEEIKIVDGKISI